MSALLALLALAAAAEPAPEPATRTERVELFVVEGHGQRLGGVAVVVIAGDTITLEALSAAGPALFTVEVAGGEARIEALDPAMATWLGRIPFARDLAGLYLADGAVRAEVGGVSVRPRRDGWKVRAGAGPARVVVDGDHRVLRDRLRGYRVDVSPLPR